MAVLLEPGAATARRHDVDALRVFALCLLIVYHVVISFQPWAIKFYFPTNEQTLDAVWILMAAFNVWRIPLVFMISGMGVCFAMNRRNWHALLADRATRILVPFAFGFFFVCPISAYLFLRYTGQGGQYIPNPGHLWFLANIFVYVLVLLPLLVFLKRPGNAVLACLHIVARRPWLLLLIALPMMLSAWLTQPQFFTTYALTWHGFWIGLICFLAGFVFAALQDNFWRAAQSLRHFALGCGFALYLVRLIVFRIVETPLVLTAFESTCWMLAVFGYGSLYLSSPANWLRYASRAVYPVYIVHLPVQFAIASVLLPLPLPALLKLAVLLAGTFGISVLLYEALRRVRWMRPAFGMKWQAAL